MLPVALSLRLAASTASADPYASVVVFLAASFRGASGGAGTRRRSYGSGSLVAVDGTSGLILTNWHVVRDAAGPIVVYFPDGFRSGRSCCGSTATGTWRRWPSGGPTCSRSRLANQAPQPGDLLTIVGYGSGSYRAITGRCTEYFSPGGQPAEMVELSAAARNGDSGGPILNSRGELAGVLFGTAFGRTTGSYCGRLRGFWPRSKATSDTFPDRVMLADQSRAPAR